MVVDKKRAFKPDYNAGFSFIGKIIFVIMIFIGIPLFRTCRSRSMYKHRRPSEQVMNTSVKPSSENTKYSKIQSREELAELREDASVGSFPEEGIYSNPQGTGGNYEDPINGFFVVEAPLGFDIKERLDKTKFVINEGSSHVGEVVPASFIQFIYANKVFIAATARKTFTTIEHDFEAVINELPKKFSGIKIDRTRFITIDGVKGGEILASFRGQKMLTVKYKKNGLDHTITINCDARDFPKFQGAFLSFLCSYRGLNQDQVSDGLKP